MQQKTQAVIFDCFGVLVTDGWLPFKARYFSDSSEKLEQATTSNRMVDAGLRSYDDFLDEMAELAQISRSQAQAEIEDNVPNAALFAFIRDELKPNYKLGILSNAGANWLPRLLEPWQLALFDEVALSCDLGVIKPHPSAYETIATKLDLQPENCIFIDDNESFSHASEQLGMKSVVYRQPRQAIDDIRELLRA